MAKARIAPERRQHEPKRVEVATSRRLTKASQFGPGWRPEDWRSFKTLCLEGLLLEPDDQPVGGLLGCRRQSRFRDVKQAVTALRKHSIYRWLARHIPLSADQGNDVSPFVQFRRLRAVAEHIVFGCGLPLEKIRGDRERRVAANAAERLLQSIESGRLWLPNPARTEFLEELLKEAVAHLRARQPRSHAYPWLRYLAQALYRETGVVDPKLILEVAAIIAPECDERTAQNYAKEARKISPEN